MSNVVKIRLNSNCESFIPDFSDYSADFEEMIKCVESNLKEKGFKVEVFDDEYDDIPIHIITKDGGEPDEKSNDIIVPIWRREYDDNFLGMLEMIFEPDGDEPDPERLELVREEMTGPSVQDYVRAFESLMNQ